MTAGMILADEPPDLVAQDDSPLGRWVPDGARMTWQPGTQDRPTRLLDQRYPQGSWEGGAGNSMTWRPAAEPHDGGDMPDEGYGEAWTANPND